MNKFNIIKDINQNDILLTYNNQIPLNTKNSSLEYQQAIYEYCKENIDYVAFEITSNLYSVIEKRKDSYGVKIIRDKIINMADIEKDDDYTFSLDYNSKYIVVSQKEIACPITDVIAAYDIKNDKMIDCSKFKIRSELIDAVVRYRRCMYDVVSSIINNEVLMTDSTRLFNFMSFITNQKVTPKNFSLVAPYIKEYIYHHYPELKNQPMVTEHRKLLMMNEEYGLDYFAFRKMDYDIPNLKYLHNKKLIKKS